VAESFSVGDRVEVVSNGDPSLSWSDSRKRPGSRGVIAGPAGNEPGRLSYWAKAHLVDFDDGFREWCAIPLLRRINDGDERTSLDTVEPLKLVRWTDCPWRPTGVRA
jgi:hypothetical protein